MESKERSAVRIVIVGAGVAGLSAAGSLVKCGLDNFVIVEALDRIGGRVYTETLGGDPIEIGAQWIHGEVGNPVFDIAKNQGLIYEIDNGLDYDHAFDDAEFRTQYGQLISQRRHKDFLAIMMSITEECHEVASKSSDYHETVASFLRSRFSEHVLSPDDLPQDVQVKEALFEWYCMYRNTIEGCDSLNEMSVKGWADYKECEGNPLVVLKNGYKEFLKVLSKNIPEDRILLNKPVSTIQAASTTDGKLAQGALPAKVICQDGEVFEADHVIVTVSLGCLKKYANSMFLPPLPDAKQHAIRTLGFGTVNKIYIEFEERFWSAETEGCSFIWLNEQHSDGSKQRVEAKPSLADNWQKAILGFYLESEQSNVMCGWIAGAEARYMEMLSDGEVLDMCLKLLKQFSQRTSLPKVANIVRSAWHSNPYTLGSYSYKTIPCDQVVDIVHDLAEPVTIALDGPALLGTVAHPSILFAGEATHPCYYSTVHGAYLTGQREVDRINAYYRSGSSRL